MPRAATSVATRTLDLVLAELRQRLLARHLGHVAVQRAGAEAALGEVVGDPLRLPLGAGEDDDLLGVLGLQDPADDLGLVEVVGLVDELRGRRHHRGVVRRLGADVHRVPHVDAGQRDDRRRHGRREQHRLAGLGGHPQDPLDVGQEAQVEHLVGLVEHQRVHVGEVERAAVGEVDQAPGRADDDVDAGLERVELGVVADAAVDGQDPEAGVARWRWRGRWRPGARAHGSGRRSAPAACPAACRRTPGRSGRRCAAAPGCRTRGSCRCRCGPDR